LVLSGQKSIRNLKLLIFCRIHKVNLFMRQLLFICLAILISSCNPSKKLGSENESEIFITRKYVGNFVDYRYTKPSGIGKPHLVWIKTTHDSVYGKISVYSRKCDFVEGERLFIRRVYPLIRNGYWDYYIENDQDNKLSYKATKFQHDKKVIITTWFK